jgi:hypothetical protein
MNPMKIVFALGLTMSSLANANTMQKYKITVTNLTKGQILSPPVVIAHDATFTLFTPGQPSSAGLAKLAEDGYTTDLVNEAQAMGKTAMTVVGPAGIKPGTSASYEISVGDKTNMLSLASMLVTTNDGFTALNGITLKHAKQMYYTLAYDAGSEANTETCTTIPGPPCGAHDMRMTAGAEGYVYIHPGIQGVGDLPREQFGFNNPVAMVVIEPVH